MDDKALLKSISRYYSKKIVEHGPNNLGVDWKSENEQRLRFYQLLKVVGDKNDSLLDYGCGYAALAQHMRNSGYTGNYYGFDISIQMLKTAAKEQSGLNRISLISDLDSLDSVDYAVASGIFNVKGKVSNKRWKQYMLNTLEIMHKKAIKGFSFNVITNYVDREKRTDLFYADPLYWFDHCKRNYSQNVALLHDYDLFEFTILVKK